MAITLQDNPKFLAVDENGSPRVGAKLFTYEPGTTTKKATYTLSDLSASNTNPIVLDSNGEATIWLNGAYKFVLASSIDTDPPASPYWTVDDIGTAAETAVVTEDILNGSFESEDSIPGTPDYWTLTGTWVLEASSNLHKGAKHLKATGTGSNTATSSFFEVTPGIQENLSWSQKTSNGTNNVKVDVDFYTNAQVFASTTTLFNAAGSATWENKSYPFTVPAGAGYAKVKVTGTVAAATLLHIDNFVLSDLQFLAGTATVSAAWAFSAGLTATTGTFSGALAANAGLTATTGTFSGALAANAGLTATTGTFSGALAANAGLTATTGAFSGQITEALGSAAAPSYAFTGDTNTGAFSPSADAWGISVGGTELMRVDGNGVGVGTTPSAWAGAQPVALEFSNYAAFITGSASVAELIFGSNTYFDGTNWRYKTNGYGSLANFQGASGDSFFYSAASGVAGAVLTPVLNVTFKQNGQIKSEVATGTSPFSITSTTVNTNLNADMVDGYHAATAATASTAVVRDASGFISTVPAATGFVGGQQVYIESDSGGNATTFDIDANIGAAWESVGPTGSGATNIWTAMDNIPSNAKAVILKVFSRVSGSTTATIYNVLVHARVTGSATAAGRSNQISETSFYNRSGLEEWDSNIVTAIVPIDSSKRFDIYASITGTYAGELVLAGFII